MGEITNALVAILLLGLVITGITLLYGDIVNHYHVENTQSLSYISKANETATLANSLKDSTEQNTNENTASLFGVEGFLTTLKLTFGSIDIVHNLLEGMVQALRAAGIEVGWVVAGLVAIFTVIIVFKIAAAILRVNDI